MNSLKVDKFSTLYLDESGTRKPDKKPSNPTGNDWFGIGGVLINDEDIMPANSAIEEFRARWPEMGDFPLHSIEIRSCRGSFTWLSDCQEVKARFLDELTQLLVQLPVIGFACVIDRPGYNKKYEGLYKEKRWHLCKTAFAVTVERAVKYSMKKDRKLRVFVERAGKKEDRDLKSYYAALLSDGNVFNKDNSSHYKPLGPDDYRACLCGFDAKKKKTLLLTIADLYLWPMCMTGYLKDEWAYKKLWAAGRLIDCTLRDEELAECGIKRSCFYQQT
jgi:hypothetical protein